MKRVSKFLIIIRHFIAADNTEKESRPQYSRIQNSIEVARTNKKALDKLKISAILLLITKYFVFIA
ncbi:MAG: hypothetical protein P8Y62_06735 [candidate division WOR-3 bacterium]|jgi:hypothetical protein